MPSSFSADRPSTAASAATVLVPLFACLVYWGFSPVLADFGGDAAYYWLSANHFSPWGEASPVAAHYAERSHFPPLFPLVLALAGGGTSLLAAHVVCVVLMWAGLVVCWRLFVRMGLEAGPALALVVVVTFSRGVLLEGLHIHSEHLYLPLSALALLLALDGRSRRVLYLAAGCAAAAYLARTVAVVLMAGLLVHVWRRHREALPGCVLICALPVLAWTLLHSGTVRYVEGMSGLYARGEMAAMLSNQAAFLWRAWVMSFADPALPAAGAVLPGALGLLALGGLIERLRRWQPDALYAAAYLALLVVWPYPAEYERMLYPVLPLLMAHALLCVLGPLAHRTPHLAPRRHAQLFLLVLLIAVLPFTGHALGRLLTPPADQSWAPYQRTRAWFGADPARALLNIGFQRAVTEALVDIREHDRVGRDECMLAIKTAVAGLYSERIVHGLPRPPIDPGNYAARVERQRCRALFMIEAASPTFPYAYFPYALLESRLEALRVYANPFHPRVPAALFARLAGPAPAAAAAASP